MRYAKTDTEVEIIRHAATLAEKVHEIVIDELRAGDVSTELELVHSGLEQSMSDAWHDILDVLNSNPEARNLRTAALILAINKIARAYMALGIFP